MANKRRFRGRNLKGNITNLVVSAAAVGDLGYGYMWWKGISFSDVMYVTKRSMATVGNLTKLLEHDSNALAEINAILGEKLSVEDVEEILAGFENLESQVCLLSKLPMVMDLHYFCLFKSKLMSFCFLYFAIF